MSMRASAMAAAGMVLSQPTRQIRPSRWCERVASSIESAMTSRLTSDPRMPSTPMVTPSETEIVLNSSGVPPASRMPCLTFWASARWLKLHGIVSIHVVATPTNGRAMSSSVKPIAFSIERAAARSGPSVITAELRFAGSDGRSYGFSDMPPILGGSSNGPGYLAAAFALAFALARAFAFAFAFAFALALSSAFCLAVRGRHGFGFTFTRLPLTVWYFGFGFLSGQSGSFFFLALTPGFVPDETLVEVVVVDFGVVPGAAGGAAGWAGGTGGIPLGRIGVPVPPTRYQPPLPFAPGAAISASRLPPSSESPAATALPAWAPTPAGTSFVEGF